MKSIRVDVTSREIALGKRGSRCLCPLALAISRALPVHGIRCWVEGAGVTVAGWMHWPLPQEARKFVKDFDRGRPVAPFTFDLNAEGGVGPLPYWYPEEEAPKA